MQVLVESKESQMNLKEEKSNIQVKIDQNIQKIVKAQEELTTARDEVLQLEQCIYEFSITNRNLNTEKEKLIEMLPEMVKVSQSGKTTPEMNAIMRALSEEKNRNRLEKILHENKFL